MFAKRTAVLALAFALIFIAGTSSQALAAKPDRSGGGGGGSVALVLLTSTDGLAHYGQDVTFAISTTTAYPYVNLKCWQGGVFVGEAWRGFFPTSISGTTFTLSGSSTWQADAGADCTAYLTYQTKRGWTVVASSSFHVDP